MRVMRGQIDTGRRQMKANLGFPVQSDVKKIPNAIALPTNNTQPAVPKR